MSGTLPALRIAGLGEHSSSFVFMDRVCDAPHICTLAGPRCGTAVSQAAHQSRPCQLELEQMCTAAALRSPGTLQAPPALCGLTRWACPCPCDFSLIKPADVLQAQLPFSPHFLRVACLWQGGAATAVARAGNCADAADRRSQHALHVAAHARLPGLHSGFPPPPCRSMRCVPLVGRGRARRRGASRPSSSCRCRGCTPARRGCWCWGPPTCPTGWTRPSGGVLTRCAWLRHMLCTTGEGKQGQVHDLSRCVIVDRARWSQCPAVRLHRWSHQWVIDTQGSFPAGPFSSSSLQHVSLDGHSTAVLMLASCLSVLTTRHLCPPAHLYCAVRAALGG